MHNNLIKAFDIIKQEIDLPDYMARICDLIAGNIATRQNVDELLIEFKINSEVAKAEFLHLIFAYINIALEDDVLTEEEKNDIKFLKVLFHIQPGDFYLHNKLDVEETIRYHLDKIYDDKLVTEGESEFKSDMQEIFDLSYDEMNEYAKSGAANLIKKGTDAKDLDIVFTYNEYFKLKE